MGKSDVIFEKIDHKFVESLHQKLLFVQLCDRSRDSPPLCGEIHENLMVYADRVRQISIWISQNLAQSVIQ